MGDLGRTIHSDVYGKVFAKMQPSNQQQVAWGNHAYPVVTPVSPTTQNSSNGKLWGSSVRRSMGIIQIICGVIEFALGITLICLPLGYYYSPSIGWGIWNGVFAVITGFLGVYSKRSKCLVIAYMVMSIIAAVLSAACCAAYSAVSSDLAYYSRESQYGGYYYDYDRYMHATALFALCIILAIVFALQMLMSILGASFTCGALSSKNNQQRIVYQLSPQPLNHPFGPAPPYTAPVTQPQPYNSAYNNPFYHVPGTIVTGTTAIPINAPETNGIGTNMRGNALMGANTMGANAPYGMPK